MAVILVIDDDAQFLEMVRRVLETDGHHVLTDSNGAKGIKLAVNQTPDLVITDLIMPEKEGLETISELKNSHPNLPIMAISGGGSFSPDSYLKIAKAMGAQLTFSKPFDVKEFIDAINELLETA